MSEAIREMTLEEFVNTLPESHAARKEYGSLADHMAGLEERNAELETAFDGLQDAETEEALRERIRTLEAALRKIASWSPTAEPPDAYTRDEIRDIAREAAEAARQSNKDMQ